MKYGIYPIITVLACGLLFAGDEGAPNCKRTLRRAAKQEIAQNPHLTEINAFLERLQQDSSMLNTGGYNVEIQQRYLNIPQHIRPYFLLETSHASTHYFLTRTINENGWLSGAWPIKFDLRGFSSAKISEWRRNASQKLTTLSPQVPNMALGALEQTVALIAFSKDSLSKAQMDKWIRDLSSRYADLLGSQLLEGVPSPKRFQYAKQTIKKHLGLDYLPLTEIIEKREGEKNIVLNAIAVDPIHGADPTTDSFLPSSKKMKTVTLTNRHNRSGQTLSKGELNWKVGENPFSARYHIALGKVFRTLAPQMTKPDYEGMRKDGKLTGLVLLDSNMGAEDGRYLLNEYKGYYEENGFRFSQPKSVEDIRSLLGELISTGEVDYIFKEAHSYGNDAFVTLNEQGSLFVGKKRSKAGKEEVVYIYKPNARTATTEISFRDAGEWMKQRDEAKGSPQLFFCDTSCSSLDGGASHIAQVGTPKFIFVGGDSSLSTFTNEPESPLYNILTGIREEKTFGQIRNSLRQAKGENPEERENYDWSGEDYLFPDQEAWREAVSSGLNNEYQRPTTTTIEVFDQKGRRYGIDELRNRRP